jgi:hypothetical protein
MIIGIDPDIEKNGIAFIAKDKPLQMTNLNFVDTVKFIDENKQAIKCIYIEAGWLNKKASWHRAQNISVAAKIGKNVGENHATGKLLEQSIIACGCKVVLIQPQSTKLSAEGFNKLTKYKGKTNQEQRDAAMLIFGRV